MSVLGSADRNDVDSDSQLLLPAENRIINERRSRIYGSIVGNSGPNAATASLSTSGSDIQFYTPTSQQSTPLISEPKITSRWRRVLSNITSIYGCCSGRGGWEQGLRGLLIGCMILTSQTLLQTWYAVAPSEFHSSAMLGFANGFGDTFDLVTAVLLGRFPSHRLRVHLWLILVGIVGCGVTLFCTQYQFLPLFHDYFVFLGFCAVGISTCFQPMLMLCNVSQPDQTRLNGLIFAVCKQLSWGSTWAISSLVFNRLGFSAIVVNSFVLLGLLGALALASSLVDPFRQRDDLFSYGRYQNENEQDSRLKANSEHGAETSPETSPLSSGLPTENRSQSDSNQNGLTTRSFPSNADVGERGVHVSYQNEGLRSGANMVSTDVSLSSCSDLTASAIMFGGGVHRRRRSTGYCIAVMVLTGCFTFEAAVHSTALELMMQKLWGFSESRAINFFCMIPCIAGLCFPVITLLVPRIVRCTPHSFTQNASNNNNNNNSQGRARFQVPTLKTQVCASLCVLSVCNCCLPFIPSVWLGTFCAVIIVMARTLLIGCMAPFVDLCSGDKTVQARLIMVQNMCYNGTWSLASVFSGYLCQNHIQVPFLTGAIFEAILMILCLNVL